MIRACIMNNLTLIILVSFSVINVLYLGSDFFTREVENPSNFENEGNEEPEQQDCQKCNEFLNCKSKKNEKIVRKTKTSTKSKILGNGDLVEQTTVTEVTETITHTAPVEEDDEVCSDEGPTSYYECLETCESKRKEKDESNEELIVPFGSKSESLDDNNDETAIVINDLVKDRTKFEQSIPNSTSVIERSELSDKQSQNDENADTSEEMFGEKKPPPPDIRLPTGLPCCLSRLVSSALRSWTFYLSGLIMDIPLYCTDRCLYTRDNDTTNYCFSTDKTASCTTNLSSLMRLHPYNFRVELEDLKTKEEILADRKLAPVIKLNTKEMPSVPSCCPVKQVVGEDSSAGLFVLRGKTPDRRGKCLDNCFYVKVGDVKQTKYCFGTGNIGTACHQKVPSISILLDTNTTLRETPIRLEELLTKSKGQNTDKKNNNKSKDLEKTEDVHENAMKEDVQLFKKKEEKNKSNEVLIPILLKNDPIKMKDEIPIAIDTMQKSINVKQVTEKKANKDKEKKANEDKKKADQFKSDNIENEKPIVIDAIQKVDIVKQVNEKKENNVDKKKENEKKIKPYIFKNDNLEDKIPIVVDAKRKQNIAKQVNEKKTTKKENEDKRAPDLLKNTGIGHELPIIIDAIQNKQNNVKQVNENKANKVDEQVENEHKLPIVIDVIQKQNIEKKVDSNKTSQNKEEKKDKDKRKPDLLKNKDIEEKEVHVHNGMIITKIIKATKDEKKMEYEKLKPSDQKSEIDMVGHKSESLKPLNNNLNTYSPEFKPVMPIENLTVLVCSAKCSDGIPMKLIRIDKPDEPVSIETIGSPEEIAKILEEPLKINCGMRIPMKLIEIPKRLDQNLDKETKSEGEKTSMKCKYEKANSPTRRLTLPFQLEKKVLPRQNNSKVISSNETQKIMKLNSTEPNEMADVDTGKSTTSNLNTENESKLKNCTKKIVGPSIIKLNRTRTHLPASETASKVENKNKETCNKCGSSEGKRTLPYRITLTERPKLIIRPEEPKKLSEDSVKDEMPIHISCCTGKPYKLKRVLRKGSDPVKIEAENPEPQGFAPVKLLPRDTSVEI